MQSERLQKLFVKTLPQPHSSLLAGIVLGARENIPYDYYNKLISSGTLHVIAASGFNITIVAVVLINTFSKIVNRKLALGFSLIGIVGYTLLAGANEAVVRAAIMGSLAYTAQALGREYIAKWALVLSASLMLIVKPSLISSVSFQLSVAATAGILWLGDSIKNIIGKIVKVRKTKISKQKKMREDIIEKIKEVVMVDLSSTLAATIAILPITLITFDRVSLVSPIANVMVLWLVPPLMFLGGLMIGVGLLYMPLATVVSWAAWPLLEMFIRIVEFWGSLPGASAEITGLSWVFGAGYYFVVISLLSLKRGYKRSKYIER